MDANFKIQLSAIIEEEVSNCIGRLRLKIVNALNVYDDLDISMDFVKNTSKKILENIESVTNFSTLIEDEVTKTLYRISIKMINAFYVKDDIEIDLDLTKFAKKTSNNILKKISDGVISDNFGKVDWDDVNQSQINQIKVDWDENFGKVDWDNKQSVEVD